MNIRPTLKRLSSFIYKLEEFTYNTFALKPVEVKELPLAITAMRCRSLRRVKKCRWKSVNYENQIFIFAKGCTVSSRLLLANCFLIAFNQSVFLQRPSFICLTVGCNFPHLYFSRNSHMYLFNEHMGAHFEETIPS